MTTEEAERIAILAIQGGFVDDLVCGLWPMGAPAEEKERIAEDAEGSIRERLRTLGFELPLRHEPPMVWPENGIWMALSLRDDAVYDGRFTP